MSIVDKLFDRSIPALEKSMDLYLKRGNAITSNIANAETPGYRAVDLNFAGELERAFSDKNAGKTATTHHKHLQVSSAGSAHFVNDLTGMAKADGNNVDLDIQMGKLVANAGLYSQGANLVRKKLHMLRTAIREAMR
jgi:flagellar basal-body rod protein FlgB